MKKCPKCNKEISNHASQCPYCGEYQPGYQPIKNRGNKKAGMGYGALVLLLVLMPLVFSYFISPSSSTNNYQPKEKVTLGAIEEVSKEEEKVEYLFESLDDFSTKITNSKTYVEKIKAFETTMETTIDKYAKPSINKSYQIIVTKTNNIFFYITYDIKVDTNQTMSIDLEYDVTGRTSNATTSYRIDHFKDFTTMKLHDDSYPMYKEVLTLINADNDLQLLKDTSNEFNKLEEDFNNRKGKIGNYGVGTTKDSKDQNCSIRVTAKQKEYSLRFKYETKIKANLY